MTQIWEYIKIAFMNIKSNKGRSVLTMLGIIIGISSVIMIISIGNTIKASVNEGLNSIAGGQIYMYSDGDNEEGVSIAFTQEDMVLLQERVKNIKAITPQEPFWGQITGKKGTFEGSIIAGNSGLKYVKSEPIIKGRYFTDSDYYGAKKVCIVDENSAKQLFGNTNVVGMTIEIAIWYETTEYTIIGIRENPASSMVTMLEGGMLNLEVPFNSVVSTLGIDIDSFEGIYIVSDGAEHASQVAKDSVKFFENRYNIRGKNAIKVENFNDIMSEITSIVDYITIFVVLVAAISLLVGGIGVMNIMLVSVTERTREIGIRKALGARTGSILLQFLSESAIISLMGGIIGILLGVAGAAGVCSFIGSMIGEVTLRVAPSTVFGASGFSIAVGIFFGIYPAKKAAKLSPIEALRHE